MHPAAAAAEIPTYCFHNSARGERKGSLLKLMSNSIESREREGKKHTIRLKKKGGRESERNKLTSWVLSYVYDTSKVAEKGRTRNPRSRSATARLAIRMWVGPRRLELKRTAAKISKLPPMVRRTMTDKATATTSDIQFMLAASDAEASVGDMAALIDVDSPFINRTASPEPSRAKPSCCSAANAAVVVVVLPTPLMLLLLLLSSTEPIIRASSGTLIEFKYKTLSPSPAPPPPPIALLRFLAIKSTTDMTSGCILPLAHTRSGCPQRRLVRSLSCTRRHTPLLLVYISVDSVRMESTKSTGVRPCECCCCSEAGHEITQSIYGIH